METACPFCEIGAGRTEQEVVYVDDALVAAMRAELGAVGVNLRQNSGSRAGQDVLHFHLHVVPRYLDDTVLPGCVWGEPPWEPPTGGDAERRRVADALRRALGGSPKLDRR